MRALARALLWLAVGVLLLVSVPVLVLYQGVQAHALVQPSASARQEDVGRIKALLYQHDPRGLRHGEVRTLVLPERDLNLGLRSLLLLAGEQDCEVALGQGAAVVKYTLTLPPNPLGGYFNMSLRVTEQDGTLAPERVELGTLQLPGWAVAPLLLVTDRVLAMQFEEYRGARRALQAVSLQPGQASATYRWDQALARRIEQRGRELLLPAADRERAVAYYQVLARTSRSVGRRAPLERLLQPLFQAARQRSTDGDAAAENRALLLVLGTVLNRSSVYRLVGGDYADLQPTHYYVYWTLHGRGDLAQHFGVSAAMAAAGSGPLADAIGVLKELDDSIDGTGFSFPDLLADRAGVELAEAAIGADAGRIQELMAASTLREADFMPSYSDLPEGLMEMEFKLRYRDLDDARYAVVKREIDSRIALLPLHL